MSKPATQPKGYRVFDRWKAKVNQALYSRFGVIGDDLMDVDYYAWFANGVPPVRAAFKAIKAIKANMV